MPVSTAVPREAKETEILLHEITPEQRKAMDKRADEHFQRVTVSPDRPKLRPGRYALQAKADGQWVTCTTGADSSSVPATNPSASVAHFYTHTWLASTTWEWERWYEARDKAYVEKSIRLEAKQGAKKGKTVKEDGR